MCSVYPLPISHNLLARVLSKWITILHATSRLVLTLPSRTIKATSTSCKPILRVPKDSRTIPVLMKPTFLILVQTKASAAQTFPRDGPSPSTSMKRLFVLAVVPAATRCLRTIMVGRGLLSAVLRHLNQPPPLLRNQPRLRPSLQLLHRNQLFLQLIPPHHQLRLSFLQAKLLILLQLHGVSM